MKCSLRDKGTNSCESSAHCEKESLQYGDQPDSNSRAKLEFHLTLVLWNPVVFGIYISIHALSGALLQKNADTTRCCIRTLPVCKICYKCEVCGFFRETGAILREVGRWLWFIRAFVWSITLVFHLFIIISFNLASCHFVRLFVLYQNTCSHYFIASFLNIYTLICYMQDLFLWVLDLFNFIIYFICNELFFKLFARIDFKIIICLWCKLYIKY